MNARDLNPANAVSLFRITMVPVLLSLAWYAQPKSFLLALGLSLASDVVDGQLARRMGHTSTLGARLDSWGDLGTYAVLPLCGALLWPEHLREEAGWVGLALVAFVGPTVYGLVKFKRLTSYHTIGAKLSAITMGGGILLWLGLGEPHLFRAACAIVALSAIEEIAITRHLVAWRTDVPSYRQLRRAERIAERAASQARGA